MLNHLLSNAIKFTPDGGRIQITATDKGEIGSKFKVLVSDSGIGIAPENTKSIFQCFSQIDSSESRRYEGTGLGLAICKKICEAMHGNLEVSSELAKGSIFCFTASMPPVEPTGDYQGKSCQREQCKGCEEHQPLTEENLKGKKILVVEDNIVNQVVAAKMLSSFGCETQIAGNGLEAINLLKEMARGNGTAGKNQHSVNVTRKKWPFFDAVLCDIQMPVLDGYYFSICSLLLVAYELTYGFCCLDFTQPGR